MEKKLNLIGIKKDDMVEKTKSKIEEISGSSDEVPKELPPQPPPEPPPDPSPEPRPEPPPPQPQPPPQPPPQPSEPIFENNILLSSCDDRNYGMARLKSVDDNLLFSGMKSNLTGYGDCTDLEFAPIRTALQDTQPLKALPNLSDAQLPAPGIDAVSGTIRPESFDKKSGKEARVTMVRADWCGFCKKAMPEWQKLTKEHHGKVVKDHKLSFRDLEQKRDENEIKTNYSDVRGFPTYVVEIMENGQIVKKESFNGIEKKDMENKLLNILN